MSDSGLTKYTPMELAPTLVHGIDDAKKRIEEIRADPRFGFLQKREMVKAEVENLRKILKSESDAAVITEAQRTKARGEVESSAIIAQKIHLMQQLEVRFQEMMAHLGQQVKMEKLHNLGGFGEKLTAFRAALAGKNIEERFLSRINMEIDKAFDDYLQKITDVAVPGEVNQRR